jgi:hypothetical protein
MEVLSIAAHATPTHAPGTSHREVSRPGVVSWLAAVSLLTATQAIASSVPADCQVLSSIEEERLHIAASDSDPSRSEVLDARLRQFATDYGDRSCDPRLPPSLVTKAGAAESGAFADTTPPLLANLSFSTSVVDVTTGPGVLTIGATGIDEGSGISQIVVWLDRPFVSGFSLVGLFTIDASGAGSRSLTVPEYMAPGRYSVTKVTVEDGLRNIATVLPAELSARGFPTYFDVIGTGSVDTVPPSLTHLKFIPGQLDLSLGPATLRAEAAASDGVSGVEQIVVWLDKPFVDGFSLIGIFSISADGSGWRTLSVPEHMGNGRYSVVKVTLTDRMRNERTVLPAELQTMGLPDHFDISGGDGADITPPQLLDLTFTPEVIDVSSGTGEFTVGAAGMDDASGVDQIVVWLDRPFVGGYSLVGLFSVGPDGHEERVLAVPDYVGGGRFRVTKVTVADRVRNERTYLPQDLADMGLPTYFSVLDGKSALLKNGFEVEAPLN